MDLHIGYLLDIARKQYLRVRQNKFQQYISQVLVLDQHIGIQLDIASTQFLLDWSMFLVGMLNMMLRLVLNRNPWHKELVSQLNLDNRNLLHIGYRKQNQEPNTSPKHNLNSPHLQLGHMSLQDKGLDQ